MKKSIVWLLAACAAIFVSCSNDDEPKGGGEYQAEVEFVSVSGVNVSKNAGGYYDVAMTLTHPAYKLQLSFATGEPALEGGQYAIVSAVSAKGQCAARLTSYDSPIKLGDDAQIAVSRSGDNYDITLTTTSAQSNKMRLHYNGEIKFKKDEPVTEPAVASGYKFVITEGEVVNSSNAVVQSVTKYYILIYDPEGAQIAEIDAVNTSGKDIDGLCGTYTMTSYPTEPWQGDNGWVVYYPGTFEMAGGTYFNNADGKPMYVTNGDVTISKATDAQGNALYSFSGSELTTITAQNSTGNATEFEIKYASEQTIGGEVRCDMTMPSALMGCDMQYSIYLPPSWDGKKEFPIIYLLHGATNGGATGHNDWFDGANLALQTSLAIANGIAPEVVIVTPNCCVAGDNLFYCDNFGGGQYPYMSFFFNEFVPYIESEYCIKSDREHRMVSGLSMGGYGSLYYGSLHPEMFSYVYACSPATYMDGAPNVFELFGADYEAGLYPGVTIEIGTSDFLYQTAEWLHGYLDGIGYAHEWITRDGAHDWTFWNACLPKILAKANECFGK